MLELIAQKIFDWKQAQQQVANWQKEGQRIVFTNGCFDLLHYGHIHYLAEARSLGDRLIIGLNTQTSVQRLKGAHRPIKDEKSRMFQLAALSVVDGVILFEEDTPYALIKRVQPDILVKGGDWKVNQIVGADIVLKKGGLVKSLAFIKGYSTTAIEAKIRSSKHLS